MRPASWYDFAERMETLYYVMYGVILVLSLFGLIVGVSNDACNFLNSSLGCRAGTYRLVAAVAGVGVIMGAAFSSGMMEVARSGVFVPGMFSFHELMVLFMAVMVANVILLDIFNTLGLPTSTTVALIFALLGSAMGMAMYSASCNESASVIEYINAGNTTTIVAAIFCSVAIAFVVGTVVMWISRLIFSFRYQRTYRYLGPLWCGAAFTSISYFAIFKGLKTSPILSPETHAYLDANVSMLVLAAFVGWTLLGALGQYVFRLNTLRYTVLAGTFALALSFAGNDLVNFIGIFMASDTCLDLASQAAAQGVHVADMKMGALANQEVKAEMWQLITAGVIMVAALFFSKKARKVTETEIKLSAANTGKERFGSSQPARLLVRYTLNVVRFVQRITPAPVAEFVGRRFEPLRPEEETGANYDMLRGSVNLTTAAFLICIATSWEMPLSTTYVTFMVAMGSSLADRAWGRDSAVYRITGVLAVVGGWFITAFAACTLAFAVALIMAYGSIWGIVVMVALAIVLLIRSTFFRNSDSNEVKILNLRNRSAVRDFGTAAAGRLGRMVGIYNAMVQALLKEDRDALKRLRKKARSMKRDIALVSENEVMPSLVNVPKEYAEQGQRIYRITELSANVCECLLAAVKAAFNHIDNQHVGLNERQGQDLLALTGKISRFYPSLTDKLKTGDYAGIDSLLESADTLGNEFAEYIKTHLMQTDQDAAGMRNGILYLTLLNETRAMTDQAFALIRCTKELFEY